jgi:hypothetical protein
MLKCKKCGGTLYEDESWTDSNGVRSIEIGCFQCANKLEIDYKEWMAFKRKLQASLSKAKKPSAKVDDRLIRIN